MTIHYILKLDDHASSLLSQLHNMLKAEIFTDLTLATDEGLSIKVHRPIMCAFSPYLKVRRYITGLFCSFLSVSGSFLGAVSPTSRRVTNYCHPQ